MIPSSHPGRWVKRYKQKPLLVAKIMVCCALNHRNYMDRPEWLQPRTPKLRRGKRGF